MTASRFEPTADDLAFFDVYGEWDPLTPAELRDLMEGFPDPWWVAGGYAIETFTGVAQHHEDIDDEHPEPLHPISQIWMRHDARSPWQVDCLLNPVRDGRWQSKRDPDFVADLGDVTWTASDGVRYATPEVALLFKAKQHRRKDKIDLENAWPLMTEAQRRWLHDAVVHLHPDHPWQDRLKDW